MPVVKVHVGRSTQFPFPSHVPVPELQEVPASEFANNGAQLPKMQLPAEQIF